MKYLRLSLRSIFVATTLVAVLVWYCVCENRATNAIDELRDGGIILKESNDTKAFFPKCWRTYQEVLQVGESSLQAKRIIDLCSRLHCVRSISINQSLSHEACSGLSRIKGVREIEIRQQTLDLSTYESILKLKGLRRLKLSHVTFDFNGGKVLSEPFVSDIRDLEFSDTRSTADALIMASFLHSLRSLQLTDVDICDADLIALRDMPGLSAVNVSSRGISTRTIGRLKFIKDVEVLCLSNPPQGIFDEDVADGSLSVVLLRDLAKLKTLHLTDYRIEKADFVAIAEFPALETLVLLNCDFSPEACKPLQKCPCLRSISLSHSPISDTAAEWLLDVTTLQTIDVSGTQMTAQGLCKILAMPHISRLIVSDRMLPEVEIATKLVTLSRKTTIDSVIEADDPGGSANSHDSFGSSINRLLQSPLSNRNAIMRE